MKNKIFVLFTLLMVLTACAPERAFVPTNTVSPLSETLVPIVAATVTFTSIPSPVLSADIPRWVLYERALSYIFLGPPGKTLPDMSKDHGLCEWEILGQKENEIYVWALCWVNNAIGTSTNAPAVIRLGKDGTILEVEMPNEGFGNLNELFPEDVLAKILNYNFSFSAAEAERIQKRGKDPSIVPLIVDQGTVLP